VLADEQVEGGRCERCKAETEKKETFQWFFKITDYSQRLLDNIDKIDWPEKIKTAQRNWIGRKEGINITYKIEGLKETVTCFTTRPDTNFGATFVVIGPEHKLVKKLMKKADKKTAKAMKEYVDVAIKKSEIERLAEGRKKTGVDTGFKAINDLNGYEMPIYVTDFVLGHVGTGAVVGVPGHDKRDFEFTQEFGLKVIRVVVAKNGDKGPITKLEQVQEEEGKMINSGFLNGMEIKKAIGAMMDHLEKKGAGKRVVEYRLRDWCISRQRYWGPPIPMIECQKCGWVAEKEENLPVKLPMVRDYKPTGDGKSPLEKAPKSWLEVKCSKCGGKAKRETDVSDTFLDSAWYFLRYPSVLANSNVPFDSELTKKWLPVDAYIGGAEHAVLHLMYSRFVTMALKDWGYLSFEEPFPFLYGHGLIIKDGAKMSKSRGNVVIPDECMDKYGVDALRMYLMFIGPYDQGGDFQDTGIQGMARFLAKVWQLCEKKGKKGKGEKVRRLQHMTVKRVTKAMEKLRYNVAIAGLMEYVNGLQKAGGDEAAVKALVLMLAPMAPYMAEEMWSKLGGKFSVHQQRWPEYDEELAKGQKVTVVVQVNGKLRAKLEVGRDEAGDKEKMLEMAKKEANVQKFVKGKKVIKEIFVGGKLVSLVVK
jgi:leucyl-tRNA synthetase